MFILQYTGITFHSVDQKNSSGSSTTKHTCGVCLHEFQIRPLNVCECKGNKSKICVRNINIKIHNMTLCISIIIVLMYVMYYNFVIP